VLAPVHRIVPQLTQLTDETQERANIVASQGFHRRNRGCKGYAQLRGVGYFGALRPTPS
jgi:hypothetical protein